jgi:hypothetical protein
MDYPTFANNIQKTHTIQKLGLIYNYTDTRCWTALIDRGVSNVLVTYHVNKYELGTQYFDIFYSGNVLSDIETDEIYDTLDMILDGQTVPAFRVEF